MSARRWYLELSTAFALGATLVGLPVAPGALADDEPQPAAAKKAEKQAETGAEKKSDEPAKPKRTADVVYVATPHDVVAKMLELAKVTKKDVIYDLGCGDGRIVVTAAKKFGCKGVGYDLDDDRVAESRANAKRAKVEALVEIKQEDIFKVDLSQASVIALYLLPEMNVKLIPQLEKLKPGSRIVAHDFDIRGVKPDQTIKMISREDGVEHKVFLWTVPLKKEAAKADGDGKSKSSTDSDDASDSDK